MSKPLTVSIIFLPLELQTNFGQRLHFLLDFTKCSLSDSMIWGHVSISFRWPKFTSLHQASGVLYTPHRPFYRFPFFQSIQISTTCPSRSNGPYFFILHDFTKISLFSTQIFQRFISQTLWFASTYPPWYRQIRFNFSPSGIRQSFSLKTFQPPNTWSAEEF